MAEIEDIEDVGIIPLQFTELDKWVGEPVWDCAVNRWRVLIGYRRLDGKREVIFTDSRGMESWESVKLTIQKVVKPSHTVRPEW